MTYFHHFFRTIDGVLTTLARWSNENLSICFPWLINRVHKLWGEKGLSNITVVASRSLGGREDLSVAGGVDAGSEPTRLRRGTPITATHTWVHLLYILVHNYVHLVLFIRFWCTNILFHSVVQACSFSHILFRSAHKRCCKDNYIMVEIFHWRNHFQNSFMWPLP